MLRVTSANSNNTISKMTTKADAIAQITGQRKALESLILIAQSVHTQQSALNELALAARPSQNFPPQVLKYLSAIEKRMGDMPLADLFKKLEAIESVTQKDLSMILYLSTLDVNQLRANQVQDYQDEDINVDYFTDAIANFKRRTQTALAMRILLNKRGVAIQPFKIAISQEKLNQEIQALKEKEVQCTHQIKEEIQQIIDESQALIDQKLLSSEMTESLDEVILAMHVNLQHLNNGGLVTEIPNTFEIVTLESGPTTDLEESKELELVSEHKTTQKEEQPSESTIYEPQYSRSYWWIFKQWILSPWATSWRSLVDKYRAK